MKNSSSQIIYNWIYIMCIMLLGFFLVGFYTLYSGNNLTKEATEAFHAYNLNDKKTQLKTEVNNRLDEIEYERHNLLTNEKEVLKAKIQQIQSVLLSTDNLSISNEDDRRLAAIQTFELIISEDPDYLYFVIDPDGQLLRSGTDDNLVGVDLYDSVDIEGNYFIRDIVKAKNKPDGLYVDYYWPKSIDGQALKKSSYCYYVPEFDFIIGSGIYHADLQEELQEKIYNRLQSYYKNKENYIFVVDYDSTARVHSDPSLVGNYVSDALSFDGDSVHKLLMNIIESEGSGYGTYQISSPNSTELSEKISFVHDLEGWDAYMGIGLYVDDLNAEVENFSILFKKHYYNQALYIVIGLLLIALILFAVFQRGAYLQKQYLQKKDLIFENLFDLSSEAIIVVSTAGDLLYFNSIADNLFHHRIDAYVSAEGLQLKHIEEELYSFTTSNDRTYFVSTKEEVISFKNQTSKIHFIIDITSQYLESNAFEQMAFTDDLTGLPNRRSLRNTYEDLSIVLKEDETLVLGIIDLDNFKEVNDTYGHNMGDLTIKILSDTFSSRLREHDYFFRYGGEEFILLLKNISLTHASALLEDINKLFASSNEETLGFPSTYSCGLIMIDSTNKHLELDDLISKADKLLYKAKQNGRNRIEM